MIHYFNPGHETAVLNASRHYHQPAHVAKMQSDLAFLPAWYASDGDFIFMETSLPDDFRLSCQSFNLQTCSVTPADFIENREKFQYSSIDLWGISPKGVHFFEKLNEQYDLSLTIPQWNEKFRFWGSRFASQKLLSGLLEQMPELDQTILPRFVSNITEIEQQIIESKDRLLIKSPYSSSGRGLIWLPPEKLAQSEKQILSGMLKKQKQVSIEKVLDKRLDFSMHFENTIDGETQFIGYSIFRTNAKGAYEKSRIARQERLEKEITNKIDEELLLQTRMALTGMIKEMYAPSYAGKIGVDMMIYQSGNSLHLHPCVEVNMRKSMGYLAIRFAENYLHTGSQGEFFIDYNSDPKITIQKHKLLQTQYPLIIEKDKLSSGYFSLCPVTDTISYHAYIIVARKRADSAVRLGIKKTERCRKR